MNTTSDYISILDKTDWRKTIHKALEDAVLSIGKEQEFYRNVEQAIAAISATYPNWDATKEINVGVDEINKKYNNMANSWIEKNKTKWAQPWHAEFMKIAWKDAMYLEILQFLKNNAGVHRMLLYGRKDIISGKQMNIPGVSPGLNDTFNDE